MQYEAAAVPHNQPEIEDHLCFLTESVEKQEAAKEEQEEEENIQIKIVSDAEFLLIKLVTSLTIKTFNIHTGHYT